MGERARGANWVDRAVKYRDVEYEVAALVTVPMALSYRYYGADEFIMNDQTFIQDTGTDSVMYYAFDYLTRSIQIFSPAVPRRWWSSCPLYAALRI